MRERGTEDKETIEGRLRLAELQTKEAHESNLFDSIIVNDSFKNAVSELVKFVRQRLG